MNQKQIDELVNRKRWPGSKTDPEVIETHGAWVLLLDDYVYKIKKPVQFAFLDYSTLEKRESACRQELKLNRRFTDQMYHQVLPVKQDDKGPFIGEESGEVIDYALQMRRLDNEREMDRLLAAKKVTAEQIQQLAKVIAGFHQQARIDLSPFEASVLIERIEDLQSASESLGQYLSPKALTLIEEAIEWSRAFILNQAHLFNRRSMQGYVRDLHGDLHSRNIFLLDQPVLFDCIEFDEAYRIMDVLDEVAFLCMDLEFYGESNFSALLLKTYLQLFPCLISPEDKILFEFYKWYRCGVRLKVTALSMPKPLESDTHQKPLEDLKKYMQLFQKYYQTLKQEQFDFTNYP